MYDVICDVKYCEISREAAMWVKYLNRSNMSALPLASVRLSKRWS